MLFQAVAVSFDLYDMRIMKDTIEHGGGDGRVAAEDLIPLSKRLKTIFFIDIDRLTTIQPLLFDNYLYIDAPRAANIFGSDL